MKKVIASALLYFCFGFFLSGQSISQQFDYITINNGLSSNYINCIIQDSKGFLWIGTNNGLNKYNGYRSEIFKYDRNDSSSISNNWISTIIEDSKGNIWIGTEGGGVNLYVNETASFKRFKNNLADSSSLSSNTVSAMFEDSKQRIWIGTRGSGFCLLNKDGNCFSNWTQNDNNNKFLKGNSVISIVEDEKGNLWLGDEINGLSYFNTTTHNFKDFEIQTRNGIPISDFTQCLLFEDEENLWIGTDNGLVLYNPKTEITKTWQYNADDEHSISSSFIRKIYIDSDKNIWLGTNGGGLSVFDRKNNKFTHFNANENHFSGLNNNTISDIFIDRSNNVIIGTLGGGVNKLDRKKQVFNHYGTNLNNENSLNNSEVRALFQDEDEIIWIGTNLGLSRFDNKTNTFKNYLTDFIYKEDASAPRIRFIFRSKDNILWVTTHSGGLYKYNSAKDKFYLDDFFYSFENTKDIIHLRNIYEDENNVFWIGTTDGGIIKYDTRNKSINRFLFEENNPTQDADLKVNCIYPKNSDEIWLGTDVGLVLFNTNTNVISQIYRTIENDTNSLVGNKIRAFYEDDNGNLWIGTRSGLSIFNNEKETFQQLRIDGGLPSEVIYGILPSDDGDIWLTTPNGLCRINPLDMEIKNFQIPQNNSLDMGGACKGLNGKLIVGGTAGFTIFNPKDIVLNQYKPNVEFTSINIENNAIEQNKHVSIVDSIVLPHNHNGITIEFAALDFTKPSHNQYKYFLEGFNETWINYGYKHEVTFTNLDPGKYILHVKGSNNDGIWNDEASTLFIDVLTPWWATRLFKASSILFIILLAFIFYKQRINRYKAHEKILEKSVAEKTIDLFRAKELAETANKAKTDFLSNMSHELRTPLSAVMGYSQMLSREKNLTQKQVSNLSTIYSSGEHLLSLISDLLDFDKIEAGKIEIHKTNFRFGPFLKTTLNIAKIKADEKGLNLEYKSLSDIPEFVFGDERRIKQIMLNLLNNAVKYTSEGKISVKAGYENADSDIFTIIVKDTGEGISKDNIDKIFEAFTQVSEHRNYIEGTGLGLPITQRLIDLMKGKLIVESELGVGSTFTVELSLSEGVETINDNEGLIDIVGYHGNEKTILVTDDNPNIALMLADLLEPLGFKVDLVFNGVESLEKIMQKLPHLLILDFVMPKMDGLELIRKIRKSSKLKKLKVIGVSASYMEKEERNEFINLCNEFLEKPIKQKLFLELIRKQLNIEWKKADAKLLETESENQTDTLIFPDQVEINEIKKYISIGDFYNVKNMIVGFENEKKYNTFCSQMRKYLEKFDDAAIIQFITKNGR